MNLSTRYLGLELQNPLVMSASPLSNNMDNLRACDEHGIGAVVFQSLFEEQIQNEMDARLDKDDMYFWYPEAAGLVKDLSSEQMIKPYLKRIETAKKEVSMPVIASINCYSAGSWTMFAKNIEEAGADALELNVATRLPYEEEMDDRRMEQMQSEIIAAVKQQISIPVAVKIGPYYTNIIRAARKMVDAGADGLVLFNRFYQPDIDIDEIAMASDNYMSAPEEMLQSLRWIGILSPQLSCDFAASTGIHSYEQVVKQLLAGATVAQICTTLYKRGLDYIPWILEDLKGWMSEKGFVSVEEFRGRIADDRLSSPKFEQIQFIKKNVSVV